MPAGKLIFSQLTDWIHPEQFRRCVNRYDGNYKVCNFPCWDQFLAMTFAQITYRESLADIEVCLRSRHDQLYRMGFRSTVAHSTLADANRERDWRIYADLAQLLITRARRLYADEPIGVELEQTVYALDSTTIDLCLSLFPWARFRSTKAAIKLHTLLDLRGPIPTMISISDGKQADVRVLDELIPGAGSLLCDGSRLRGFPTALSLCAGRRVLCHPRQNQSPTQPPGIAAGGRFDRSAQRSNRLAAQSFQHRSITPTSCAASVTWTPKTGKGLVFLTNNFDLPALTIAQLYKCRWQVELFFKWIKQNLRIKHFLRHHRQRGQDPGLDRRLRLCAGGHRAQATWIES